MTASSPLPSRPRVAVVGGSLGGLMAALALRRVGCVVEVFERVPTRLEGQGAGLRVGAELAEFLRVWGDITLEAVSTPVSRFQTVGAGDAVLREEQSPSWFTSWGSMHGALARQFGAERYHLGATCVGLDNHADRVDVAFADGSRRSVDLVVFADGILSTGRALLAPESPLDYSGYVAWRGYAPADALSTSAQRLLGGALTYCMSERSHIGIYPIPHPTRRDPDARFFNFVWYRNAPAGGELERLLMDRSGVARQLAIPMGALRHELADEIKAVARAVLPPCAAELVVQTDEPFLQAICDRVVPRMAYGRACLVGDAAFVARPHAGASAGKAALNVRRLAEAIAAANFDIPAALAAWEPAELTLGEGFVARNQAIGRRSLAENTFDPFDPECRPGLYPGGG